MKTSYSTGLLAETLAILLLTCKCYRIIARRYKTRVGEVDIIAKRGKTVVFIEVKRRGSTRDAIESISGKQQARIISAAELFLSKYPQYSTHKKRFDAVLITSNLLPEHIENAWGKR